jgi:hypothetical protein
MKAKCGLFFIIFLTFSACNLEDGDPGITIFSDTFNFDEDQHGFAGGFSEYPAGPYDSSFYELQFAYTREPGGAKALMLSGINHSDDLFMFLKKKLTGLEPNTDYTITFNIEFASDAEEGMVGVGGAPGESVFLKVGATAIEPKSVIERGRYIMNIDKGQQGEDGIDMVVIGNVAVPAGSDGYAKVVRTNASSTERPLEVKSTKDGELWITVGTDSGFEGKTTLFYTAISVVLSARN